LGLERKRRGQTDALELAAGKLGRAPLSQVAGPHGIERRLDSCPDPGRSGAQILKAEGHFVADNAQDDLVFGVLKDGRNCSGELGRPRRPRIEPGYGHATREASTVEMRDETGEGPQQRRLPRSGWPEERYDFSLCKAERDVLQGRLARSRIRVGDPIESG
jgi:hypothetical protein